MQNIHIYLCVRRVLIVVNQYEAKLLNHSCYRIGSKYSKLSCLESTDRQGHGLKLVYLYMACMC